MKKRMAHLEDLQALAENEDFDVLIVLGAGDADNRVPAMAEVLRKKYGLENKINH